MRRPVVTGQFKRDVERMKRRGRDAGELRQVLECIIGDIPLAARHRDHKLRGEWRGRRECHVQPDWLLIYQLPDPETVIFERTGTHADLFE